MRCVDCCVRVKIIIICMVFNPYACEFARTYIFLNDLLIYIYIACDKECAMATCVPNPISLYYTWKERLSNNLPFEIKHVLIYRRTHLEWSNERH